MTNSRGGRSVRSACVAVVAFCLLSAAHGAFAAAPEAVKVESSQQTANGMQVVLSIAPPELRAERAKDGKTYTKVALPGCGNDNAVGLPALPIISHTVEIPWGAEATVVAEAANFSLVPVQQWIYPQQPPTPKVPGPAGNPPFEIDTDYYTGAKAAGLRKSLNDGEPALMPFKKRGHQYLNILVRPFAYDPVKGLLQSPGELRLDIAWTVNPLPKAAGPRTGKITIVEITLGDLAELDALTKDGYDISNRQGKVVTLYVTDAELAALRQKGYTPKEIDYQPRPPEPKSEAPAKGFGAYHTYATLTTDLQAYAAAFPAICRLTTLGQSVQGRELRAMKITDNPDLEEDEPEVKYVADMHGDEVVGMEMCMYLIDLLLNEYATNPRIASLVNETEIWIVPTMNPDGLTAGTRYNASGVDLNRSFPDGAETFIGNVLYGPAMNTAGLPIEVVRVMQWTAAHRFVLSANFHGGALLVNYPYDNDNLGSGVDSPSPDDALFEVVSRIYSSHNAPMWNSPTFQDGISNGAAWYELIGGMQDWNYRYAGCNEVTIELSDNKTPPASQLPQFWAENEESMLSYFESVNMGVRGIVTDAVTGDPVAAAVMPVGINHMVYTDPDVGDYHRPLLPGTYTLAFSAPGYRTKIVEGVTVTGGAVTRLDVTLTPGQGVRGKIALVFNAAMAGAAADFKAQKVTEGFEVFDVSVSGGTPAETVRGQIRTVYNAHQPEYVIILGDIESVPTFSSADANASDLPYALMDPGEGFANYLGKDLIVGRVSVDSAAVVGDYTDKLAAFAASPRHRDLTWVSSGNDDSQYDIAEGTHNWVMANTIPEGYHHELFYRGNPGPASALSAHINAGTDGVVYSGHGGEYAWQRYDYSVSSLTALTNAYDAPIVFGHCCVTGSFQLPTCFAEAWLETTARGIAYVGASNNSYWDEDDILERQEFQAMEDTPNLALGDAVERGLEHVYSNYPTSAQYYYTIYHVFGDPTVALFGDGGLAIITGHTLPLAYADEPYSVAVTAVSGVEPYTWHVAAGTLPAGLTFDSNTQLISGIPTAPGPSTFTLEVEDAVHTIASREFLLNVVRRFMITTPATLPTASYGYPYHTQLASLGGSAPVSWKLIAEGDYTEDTTGTGWIGGGTAQGWQDDDGSWPLTLPWPFTFYGTDYTSVNVCSNGYLDFASSSADYNNLDADLKANVRIAALWDDLTTAMSGSDIFVTQTAEYVVVRWSALTFTGYYPINTEVVLYRNGNVRFNYGPSHWGLTPTMGISAGDGIRFTLSARNGYSSIPSNATSLFAPPIVLPQGLTFDESGAISGTASVQGSFNFTVEAKDSGDPQQMDTRDFVLNVRQFTWLEVPRGGWNEAGNPLHLNVRVDGTYGAVTYQWIKDGVEIADATEDTFDVESLTLGDQGWYSCRVTDETKGTYTTVPVFVQVFPQGSLPATGVLGLGTLLAACLAAGMRTLRRRN